MSHEGTIIVVDENFHEKRVTIASHRATGRDIIEAAGHQHTDQFFVLIAVDGGGLRELSQDEHTEFATDGSARFFVIKGDRLYRFEIDGKEFVWPLSPVLGSILYDIAGVKHADVAIWQEGEEHPREIKPEEEVVLTGKGVEKFVVKPREHVHFIFINGDKYEVKETHLNGGQIKALGKIESDYRLFLEQPGDDQPIADSQSVKIIDGQHFYSLPPATFG
jgi:Multiubiquitin